jgi:hypothetical protein
LWSKRSDEEGTGLFKKGHELKDSEGSADLQVLEPAIQSNRLRTEEEFPQM